MRTINQMRKTLAKNATMGRVQRQRTSQPLVARDLRECSAQ